MTKESVSVAEQLCTYASPKPITVNWLQIGLGKG